MKATKSGRFTITPATVTANGCTYETYRLTGWINGKRVRRQFTSRDEAIGEKHALEVEAANVGGEIRARNTRLNPAQLAEAEAAFARLGSQPLSLAVEWFLETYRPPVEVMSLEKARDAFLAQRKAHVRSRALRDYKNTLKSFVSAYPCRSVHKISSADVLSFLEARPVGKKRFNNLRGDLGAFFAYCASAPRSWTRENPVKPIPVFGIARGVPEIITAQRAAEVMAYVENYSGSERSTLHPGCLAPYFALCLFAGLRPSLQDGEISRLARHPDLSKIVNLELGVIRVTPDISKVNDVRQITIQPNLAAWLVRYPLRKFPIIPPNARRMIEGVREKFALTQDVLRHTFISMHVAKFKSLGDAALQAGNSETMIKKHYLNMVTVADAEAFWAISPGGAVAEVVSLTS